MKDETPFLADFTREMDSKSMEMAKRCIFLSDFLDLLEYTSH